MDPENPAFTIVGVVGDVHHGSLERAVAPEVFVSALQQPWRTRGTMTVVVRPERAGLEASVGPALREAVRQLDADVPVEFSTLDRLVGQSVAPRRFLLIVLGVFAGIALLLAGTGIYGVLAYSVAQRTQEIGIRMALGADARSVVRLMLGTAMRAVGVGLVAGAVAAALSVRAMQSCLFGVRAVDPLAFGGAAAVLLAIAWLAGYIPARRATRVDPLVHCACNRHACNRQ